MELSQSKSKYIKSLHRGRYRQKYQNFIAEGTKIADEVLQSCDVSIELIVALPEWIEKNTTLLGPFVNKLYEANEKSLREISLLSTPNQVLIVANQPAQKLDIPSAKSGLTLFLDRIQDPGNLGTILRIADWFGVKNVVRSPGTVELFNPKVVQSSMGAVLRINSPQLELEALKSSLEEVPLLAAALEGENLFQLDFPEAAVMVLGNESNGISSGVAAMVDKLVTIPKGKGGKAESLNASVAAGIVVAEWAKRWNA
ncbi:MAG: hypothetical protein CMN32_10275 [Saprospirales bacterium]|nr:hypothetical protein [Saprospirales bacterium]